jgi:competence protein ComEA
MNSIQAILAALSLSFASFAFAGQPVDINTADANTLADSLDGVGLAKAEAIVTYRKTNGAFKSADELVNVKGIGLRTVEKNKELIRLGSKAAQTHKPAG